MRRLSWIVCLSWVVLSAGLESLSASFAGHTGASILSVPVGARATGMGGAFTAVADDVSALYWNPAGLVQIEERQFQTAYQQGLDDAALEYVGYAQPAGGGAVASSLLFGQGGTIEINRTDDGTDTGTPIGSETREASSDLLFSTAWAQNIPVGGSGKHSAGVVFKYLKSTLAENFKASSYAWDFGYLIRIPDQNLNVGAAIRNWGNDLRYSQTGDDLPRVIQAGLAWKIPDRNGDGHAETVAADFLWPKNEDFHWSLGGEFGTKGPFVMRAGYEFRRDLPGLSLGLGFRRGPVSIDYAFGFLSAISDPHRASILWHF